MSRKTIVSSFVPVANVQDLAASHYDGSKDIPRKYIRPEAELDPVIDENNIVDLPVIDLGRLLDPQSYQEESIKLNHACEEWGFFQLTNHGISNALIDRITTDVTEFFKLPLEQKKCYAMADGRLEGYGQHFVVSENQKLDWADLMFLVTQPPTSRNMSLWPPMLRYSFDTYSSMVKETTSFLLECMGKNLGLDEETLPNEFKHKQSVRINYYPPCPNANKVLGLSPHTDSGVLTLLLQLSDVQGLQIRNKGKWFPVRVLPGAVVVNIGDVLEIISNGRYKSVEHRAVIDHDKERISIAAFHTPANDFLVAPLSQLVEGACDVKYRSMTWENYSKAYVATKLEGRCMLEKMKLARSLPHNILKDEYIKPLI